MKSLITALPVLLVLLALSGCPQSKPPDMPPHAPQPKAAMQAVEAIHALAFFREPPQV
jgi:predicted small lipoprotein YifL